MLRITKFGDARTLIDNNKGIIADIAVGLMNEFGTPTDNKAQTQLTSS